MFEWTLSDLGWFDVLYGLHLGYFLQETVYLWMLVLQARKLLNDGIVSAQQKLEIVLEVFMLQLEVV